MLRCVPVLIQEIMFKLGIMNNLGRNKLASIWKQVLKFLEQRVPSEQIDEWLKPAEILEESEKTLKLVVSNELFYIV